MNALIVLFFIVYGVYALFYNIKFWIIYIVLVLTYYYFTQIKLFGSKFNSLRRKVSIATWSSPNDPQTYSKLKLDITKMESFLEKKSVETGEKITLTIFVIKLISIVLKKYPELYGYIRFGRFVPKDRVDICCLVAVGDGNDLANTTIRSAEEKDLVQISQELKKSVENLRAKKSKEHNKKMGAVNMLPTFIIGPLMQLTAYLSSIGIGFSPFGLVKYEFGSCVITSIGSLGIDDGYPPIPPLTFDPLLISICKKRKKFYYDENHQIKEKSTLSLNFTVDYRFVDPYIAENVYKDIKRIGENPDIFENEMNDIIYRNLDKKDK